MAEADLSAVKYIDSVHSQLCMMDDDKQEVVRSKLAQYAYNKPGPGEDCSFGDVLSYSTPMSERTGPHKRKAVSPLVDLYKSLEQNPENTTGTLVLMIKALEQKMEDMELAADQQDLTIADLTKDYDTMYNRCRINEGRLTRQEKELEDLREELLQANARAMKDNIIFHNIPESDEPDKPVITVLTEFLTKEMKMSEESLSEVSISKIYRQGKEPLPSTTGSRPRPRPIIATVAKGKSQIWTHTKNLKDKNYSVFTQLPRELAERKRQLLPKYKDLRSRKVTGVKWAGEKLIVGGKVKEAKPAALKDINLDTTEKAIAMKVNSSLPRSYNGSSFRAAKIKIESTDDAISALHAVYADLRSARATHNIYAYRLNSGGKITEHYEDDGEHGAGRKLLNLLQSDHIDNQLVVVSRWCGDQHLGPSRFDYILEAAQEVISA